MRSDDLSCFGQTSRLTDYSLCSGKPAILHDSTTRRCCTRGGSIEHLLNASRFGYLDSILAFLAYHSAWIAYSLDSR